jgi:site-specific recombinase XerD
MRQVIRRFLKHLKVEKNASATTIESYQYDLHKFYAYLVKRRGNRFLPGDVTRDHIRDYLMWLSEVGHQKPNGPSARAPALAAIRSFFKYAHRAGLLRDDPDIPLPKIRMGAVRALSRDECERVLRVVGANPSPFRKVRDMAMIVTFLLTGARLREIVHLDRGDIDLHQSTTRLHRKGGEVNILPLADSARIELKAYLKQRRRRNRTKRYSYLAATEEFHVGRSGIW